MGLASHSKFLLASVWLLLIHVAWGTPKERTNVLFCIADDWGYGHAGAYGDPVVSTPNFDRLAKEGMLFHHAFSAAPSCTPSRAAILTGRHPHQLEEGGVLHAFLPKKYSNYATLLQEAGYWVGHTSKAWGPGRANLGGYDKNPAGQTFKSFAAFLNQRSEAQPFCFWLGSMDPHRPYETGSGRAAGLDPNEVKVPGYWPDNESSRDDILDYYFEVQRFDQQLGAAIAELEKRGLLDNTVIVVTGDNGMPFPRCKANLYDGGTRQPLVVRWGNGIAPGQVSHDFVNLLEFAPTFLELAGLPQDAGMYGKSLLPVLLGKESGQRREVFLERERHAYVRENRLGYPMRAVRDSKHLYIRNFEPERWPAGEPVAVRDPGEKFGDVDAGLIKSYLLDHESDPQVKPFFELCFGKRPAEELYDLEADPYQLHNLAAAADKAEVKREMAERLQAWMKHSGDPRIENPHTDYWDKVPYFGGIKGPIDAERLKSLSQ